MGIGMDQATKKAKKYALPGPGEFVRFPSVEVYLAYLKLHDLHHVGFRGDMAIAQHTAVNQVAPEDLLQEVA